MTTSSLPPFTAINSSVLLCRFSASINPFGPVSSCFYSPPSALLPIFCAFSV